MRLQAVNKLGGGGDGEPLEQLPCGASRAQKLHVQRP